MKSRTRGVNICPFIFLEPGLSGSVFGANLSLYRLPISILNFILPPACKELKNPAQLPALGLQVELVVQDYLPFMALLYYGAYNMGLYLDSWTFQVYFGSFPPYLRITYASYRCSGGCWHRITIIIIKA